MAHITCRGVSTPRDTLMCVKSHREEQINAPNGYYPTLWTLNYSFFDIDSLMKIIIRSEGKLISLTLKGQNYTLDK